MDDANTIFASNYTRRGMLVLLSSAAAMAALSGCGESSSKPVQPVKTGRDLEGQLVISINSSVDPKAQQALTQAYQHYRPKVKLIWELPGASVADYGTWLGTQLAAGNIRPDIISGNYAPTFRNFVNFDQYRKSINPFTNTPWDQTLNWDFYTYRNAKGERIMLPTRSVHIMWFYNKDIFDHVGVQPPTNWSEFQDVCAKIKAAGTTPLSINFTYQLQQWVVEMYFDQYHIDWINTVRAQPGDWCYDPNLDGKFKLDPNDPNIHSKYTYNVQRFLKGVREGTLRFDTPRVAEIVKNLALIFPRYATSDVFVTNDTYTPFLQQKVAMTLDGSWSLAGLQNDLASLSPERLKQLKIPAGSVKSFNWSTFENPPMQGPLVNSPIRGIESSAGEYLSIVNKNQQQTNLALDFLMFFTSNVGYKPFNDAMATTSTYSPGGPLQVKNLEDAPQVQKLFAHLKQSGNAEVSYNAEWLAWGGGNIQRDLDNLYQKALQGQITPQVFGQNLQQYVTQNFDAILKQYQLTSTDVNDPARQPGS